MGALSFEPRCYGVLKRLKETNVVLRRGLLLDYETEVKPESEARDRRRDNLEKIQEISRGLFSYGLEIVKSEAYVFSLLQAQLEGLFAKEEKNVPLILDITCLTKVHALAAAAYMAIDESRRRLVLGYTIPENYGFIDEAYQSESSWLDLIIAPLAETGVLVNESSSRGIIVPGHESHRLVVAIGEIEPAGGVVFLPELPERPDLRHLMLRRNQRLVQQLTRMKSRTWTKEDVDVENLGTLSEVVERVIREARGRGAPVILFPFGPKPLIFATAFQLAAEYPEASWFVYPVPASYDMNYTFGLGRVLFFEKTSGRRAAL